MSPRYLLAAGLLAAAPGAFADDSPTPAEPPPAGAASPVSEPLPGPEDTRARELYDNGVMLYAEGRYEDAVAAWQEAYALSARPLLLYDMANAMERLGRFQEAIDLLGRYRAYAPASERDTLERRIRSIELRAATPPSAGPTPAAPRRIRPLPFVFGGIGVAGIAAGAAFGAGALDARREAAGHCGPAGDSTLCTDAAETALARDRAASVAADVSFGVGALGVAVGVLTAVVGGRF